MKQPTIFYQKSPETGAVSVIALRLIRTYGDVSMKKLEERRHAAIRLKKLIRSADLNRSRPCPTKPWRSLGVFAENVGQDKIGLQALSFKSKTSSNT